MSAVFHKVDVVTEPAWGPDKKLIPGGRTEKGVLFIKYSQGGLSFDVKAEQKHLDQFKLQYADFLEKEKKGKTPVKAPVLKVTATVLPKTEEEFEVKDSPIAPFDSSK